MKEACDLDALDGACEIDEAIGIFAACVGGLVHLFGGVEEGDLAVLVDLKGGEDEGEEALTGEGVGFVEGGGYLPRVNASFEEFGGSAQGVGGGLLVAKAACIGDKGAIEGGSEKGRREREMESFGELKDQHTRCGGVDIVEIDIAFESRGEVMIEDDEASHASAFCEHPFGGAGKLATIAKDGDIKAGIIGDMGLDDGGLGEEVEAVAVGGIVEGEDLFAKGAKEGIESKDRAYRVTIGILVGGDQKSLTLLEGMDDIRPDGFVRLILVGEVDHRLRRSLGFRRDRRSF